MVTCNYHGINVYFLVYLKIYLFSRQFVNVKISSRIKGLALLSFHHKFKFIFVL